VLYYVEDHHHHLCGYDLCILQFIIYICLISFTVDMMIYTDEILSIYILYYFILRTIKAVDACVRVRACVCV
jgi:hypothetical protein